MAEPGAGDRPTSEQIHDGAQSLIRLIEDGLEKKGSSIKPNNMVVITELTTPEQEEIFKKVVSDVSDAVTEIVTAVKKHPPV